MSDEQGSEQSGNPEGGEVSPWGTTVEGIEDTELRGWVENKGFTGADKMADSYRNLERLMGADKAGRTIVMPGEDASDADYGEFYGKIGRPDTAADYSIATPDGGDPAFAEWAKGTFHELGLSSKQAEGLTEKWNSFTGEMNENQLTQYSGQVEEDDLALKKEWGAAYDKNINVSKAAAREFGLDGKTIEGMEKVMGFKGLMTFMQKVGSKLGEDSFDTGKTQDGFGTMTPAAAMSAIADLKLDDSFRSKLLGGDRDAQAKMDRLHRYAGGTA